MLGSYSRRMSHTSLKRAFYGPVTSPIKTFKWFSDALPCFQCPLKEKRHGGDNVIFVVLVHIYFWNAYHFPTISNDFWFLLTFSDKSTQQTETTRTTTSLKLLMIIIKFWFLFPPKASCETVSSP